MIVELINVSSVASARPFSKGDLDHKARNEFLVKWPLQGRKKLHMYERL